MAGGASGPEGIDKHKDVGILQAYRAFDHDIQFRPEFPVVGNLVGLEAGIERNAIEIADNDGMTKRPRCGGIGQGDRSRETLRVGMGEYDSVFHGNTSRSEFELRLLPRHCAGSTRCQALWAEWRACRSCASIFLRFDAICRRRSSANRKLRFGQISGASRSRSASLAAGMWKQGTPVRRTIQSQGRAGPG